jgi:hypothetical protein
VLRVVSAEDRGKETRVSDEAGNPESEQPENGAQPPDAAKVIGQVVLTVNAAGALNIGGAFPDPQWAADTMARALRFMDRELLAKRIAREMDPPVKLASSPTPRWPIR